MNDRDKRAQAVLSLKFLRDELERHQKLRPESDILVPRSDADSFNEALLAVADELGTDHIGQRWAPAFYIRENQILPKSKRAGRPVDAVGRDWLLGRVKEVLRLLGED